MMITDLTVLKLLSAMKSGKITKLQVMQAYLDNKQPASNAFITRLSDDELLAGATTPFNPSNLLEGIPMSIKDNIMTKGIQTTCGDRMLEGFLPPYNATVYHKLLNQGAQLIGKTNLDAFAMGSTTENPVYGTVRNPLDPRLTAGGSSGGSAASVSAGECAFSIGTDTGGSARQPAAYCNITAIKPTYGRISRYGLNAFASSMDTACPMTRDVSDAAYILSIICGRDTDDMTTYQTPAFEGMPTGSVKGLRIALALEKTVKPIEEAVLKAALTLEKLGAVITEEKSLFGDDAIQIYAILTAIEASSNLARFDGIRYGRGRDEGFSSEVKRRIVMGAQISGSLAHERALENRGKHQVRFGALFESYDALLCPVTPSTAFPLGTIAGDPLAALNCDRYTVSANLTGLPALAMPFKSAAVQVYGPPFREKTLFDIGLALERADDRHGI